MAEKFVSKVSKGKGKRGGEAVLSLSTIDETNNTM